MNSQAFTFPPRGLVDNAHKKTTITKYPMNDGELKVWVDSQGNKRVCTELFRNGKIDRSRYIADVTFCRNSLSETVMRGYRVWGPACASLMQRSPWFMTLIATPTKWFIEDSAFHMSLRDTPHWGGRIVRNAIFVPACVAVASIAHLLSRRDTRKAARH